MMVGGSHERCICIVLLSNPLISNMRWRLMQIMFVFTFFFIMLINFSNFIMPSYFIPNGELPCLHCTSPRHTLFFIPPYELMPHLLADSIHSPQLKCCLDLKGPRLIFLLGFMFGDSISLHRPSLLLSDEHITTNTF